MKFGIERVSIACRALSADELARRQAQQVLAQSNRERDIADVQTRANRL